MKRRSGKYLNAREYAERLRLSDNKDVQDFADAFLDALDDTDSGDIRRAIDDESIPADVKGYVAKVEWLGTEASALSDVEKLITEKCPEYENKIDEGDIIEVVEDMIKRLRPAQVYDL